MLTLYDYFRSSACFRVRITLHLKKIDYKKIPIHLTHEGGQQFSEFYQKINPQQLVPAVQDNNYIITQSLAIIEYLNEVHPTPPLLPENPYEKALVRSFAFSIAADLHPINNLRILKYLTNEFNISEEQKKVWYQHWVKRGLSALEQQLSSTNYTKEFCFGSHPTLADICLVPQMYNARRFDCDLSTYPLLVRIDANCQQHEAFIKAWPKENESSRG